MRRDGPGNAIGGGRNTMTDVNPMASVRNDAQGSWGPPGPRPPVSAPSGGNWNQVPPPARGNSGWDDSPPMNRRVDDGGTSYWGGPNRDKPPGPPPPGGKNIRQLNYNRYQI